MRIAISVVCVFTFLVSGHVSVSRSRISDCMSLPSRRRINYNENNNITLTF